MTLSDSVLRRRAEDCELRGSERIQLNLTTSAILDAVLHDVYAFLRPKPVDYEIRNDLVRIFDWLAKRIPGSTDGFPVVEAFGSFTMGLFTAKSDLDVSVNFSHDEAQLPRDKKIHFLRKIAKVFYSLRSQGHLSSVQPILRARVPIVKIVDEGTGVECDISVENKDGVARSRILSVIFPIDGRFRLLSFLMKVWAKAHDINSSKERTLSSLAIVSLVAFHLQGRSPPVLPPFSVLFKDGHDVTSVENAVRGLQLYGRENRESLAELFVSLLTKLASVESLWSSGLCASIYEGAWIVKSWDSQDGNISVEDFLDRSQNNARSVGEAEVTKIYQCIHQSLHQIFSFSKGWIPPPELKRLLFGLDAVEAPEQNVNYDVPTLGQLFGEYPVPSVEPEVSNSNINHKRSFPYRDPSLDSIPLKVARYAEEFDKISRFPPRFGYGWRQTSSLLEQPHVGFEVPPALLPPTPYNHGWEIGRYPFGREGGLHPLYP